MLRIFPIRVFADNYAYLIRPVQHHHSMLVDPADHTVILPVLQQKPEIKISHLLLTHRHKDHVGDLPSLVSGLKDLYGSSHIIDIVSGEPDEISGTTMSFAKHDSFNVDDLKIKVIMSPCHTRGHVMYYLYYPEQENKKNEEAFIKPDHTDCYRCVFTGDTHFIAGCGRFFEGTAAQMMGNLNNLRDLPKNTFLFCGHEYTKSNLEWAMKIEWENESYAKKLEQVNEKLGKGLFTVPSMVGEEENINIFWRFDSPLLKQKLGVNLAVEVMNTLREMKNKNVGLRE